MKTEYIDVFLDPIRKCADYGPKFGVSGQSVSFEQFEEMYSTDPLYHWIGLDTDAIYAAHRAAGGITSVYRQLGIGCERLFRQILIDGLELNPQQIEWSYEIQDENTPEKTHTLTLDARIHSNSIPDKKKRVQFINWLVNVQKTLDLDTTAINGAVFEIRQGYKSADSKRQNADLRNSTRALGEGYIFVMSLFSQQVSQPVIRRYRNSNILVQTGNTDGNNIDSTFIFIKEILNFDIELWFNLHSDKMKNEITTIVSGLLKPNSKT